MFNKLAVVYALCGCIASGHWFANEYGESEKNSIGGFFVCAAWPIYASFVFFGEEE